MSYYLKKREKELRRELELADDVPSHDVFSDIFRVINVDKFMEMFVEWTKKVTAEKAEKESADHI